MSMLDRACRCTANRDPPAHCRRRAMSRSVTACLFTANRDPPAHCNCCALNWSKSPTPTVQHVMSHRLSASRLHVAQVLETATCTDTRDQSADTPVPVYCTSRTLTLKAAESYNRWCNYFVNAWNVMKVQSFHLHNVTDIKKWFIDSRGARPSDIAYVHGCFALLGAEQNALGQEIHGLIHRDPRTPPYTGPPMDNFLTFNQHLRTSRMHLRSVRANGTFAQREWADQALSLVANATEYLQANADRWVNPSSNGPVRSQDIRVAEDTSTEEDGEQPLNASTPPFRASFRTHQSQRWQSNHPCANNMSVAAEGAHRRKRHKKDTPTVEPMAMVDNRPFEGDHTTTVTPYYMGFITPSRIYNTFTRSAIYSACYNISSLQ